jgi:hypothetical protein
MPSWAPVELSIRGLSLALQRYVDTDESSET